VFLLLLCNDPQVLGPWMNHRWLNILASVIMGVLLALSGTLVVTTLFPAFNSAQVAIWLAVALVAGTVAAGGWLWLTRDRRPPPPPHQRAVMSRCQRQAWRMPQLALLKPVAWSPGTKLGMAMLRGYLVISVLAAARTERSARATDWASPAHGKWAVPVSGISVAFGIPAASSRPRW
jgi:hypothetical protein